MAINWLLKDLNTPKVGSMPFLPHRGHSLRIQGRLFRPERRRNFFTQRVVSLWNSLPHEIVEAKTLYVFKKQLDITLGAKGIKGYGGKARSG